MTDMQRNFEGFAAIFDLDGTLVDTADDLAASMNVALAAAGLPSVPAGEVRLLVGHGARAMLARGYELAAGRAAAERELDDGLAVFLEHYQENIAVRSRPFDGAVELIRAIRAGGGAAAICTNKREALARLLLQKLGLDTLFGAIVGADTASAPKPDPAPVRLCMDQTGARRALFFGDSDTDIAAAHAAGLPCFIAGFGYGPMASKAKAAVVFDSYETIAETVLRDFSR